MKTESPLDYPVDKSEKIIAHFSIYINIDDNEEADLLAIEVQNRIISEFKKKYPLLSLFFELEIEEVLVEYGSRKSKHKAKLKKKKGAGLWKILVLSYTLLSTDYNNIEKNFEKITVIVQEVYSATTKIEIDDFIRQDDEIDGKKTKGKDT